MLLKMFLVSMRFAFNRRINSPTPTIEKFPAFKGLLTRISCEGVGGL